MADEKRKFFFFVDGTKYENDSSSITGAEIKQKIPNFAPGYSLFLEGDDNDPDKLVQDNDSFDLERKGHGPLRFHVVPPATFGRNACD